MQEKLDRLQEVKKWEEQRSHLCNLIAWEAVNEQQVLVEHCDRVLNGSAKIKMRQVQIADKPGSLASIFTSICKMRNASGFREYEGPCSLSPGFAKTASLQDVKCVGLLNFAFQ